MFLLILLFSFTNAQNRCPTGLWSGTYTWDQPNGQTIQFTLDIRNLAPILNGANFTAYHTFSGIPYDPTTKPGQGKIVGVSFTWSFVDPSVTFTITATLSGGIIVGRFCQSSPSLCGNLNLGGTTIECPVSTLSPTKAPTNAPTNTQTSPPTDIPCPKCLLNNERYDSILDKNPSENNIPTNIKIQATKEAVREMIIKLAVVTPLRTLIAIGEGGNKINNALDQGISAIVNKIVDPFVPSVQDATARINELKLLLNLEQTLNVDVGGKKRNVDQISNYSVSFSYHRLADGGLNLIISFDSYNISKTTIYPFNSNGTIETGSLNLTSYLTIKNSVFKEEYSIFWIILLLILYSI